MIQTLTDANGNLTGYSVTVHSYSYFSGSISDELTDIFSLNQGYSKTPGSSSQNSLASEIDYAPFIVSLTDAPGSQYTEDPPQILKKVDFYQTGGLDGTTAGSVRLPSVETDYVGDGSTGLTGDGSTRVTSYADYVDGKPGTVTVTVNRGTASQIVSSNRNFYDADGNLIYSFDALGQGTLYVYSDGTDPSDPSDMTNAVPKGLLLETWRVTGEQTLLDNDPNTNPTKLYSTPDTQNTYYTKGDLTNVPGAAYGKLKTSINATGGSTGLTTGQLTYYTYDGFGNLINQYTLEPNPQSTQESPQPNIWVGTTNFYSNESQPPTAVYQAEYLDTGTAGVLDLGTPTVDGLGTGGISEPLYNSQQLPIQTSGTGYDALGRVTGTTDQFGAMTQYTYDAVGNQVRVNNPLQTSGTGYDALGRVTGTTDQFGATTQYTYDAVGNQVKVKNVAAGTSVLSAYDPMGRVIWQTDPFLVDNTTANPTILTTQTIYDSLGRVIETDRYQFPEAVSGLADGNGQWTVTPTYLATNGTLISSTHTYYDAQGRTIESDDASGLRTGTIYYDDGQVQYTGVLTSSAALGGGTAGAFSTSDFTSYTTYLYNQFDTSTGKPFSGMLYNRVIDADGHHTDTYQDVLGRTIFTVYDDGSYSQTLYGVGNSPVVGHVVSGQTIDGYQTTSIDAMSQATDSFYDRAGRLTDVYEPAVLDADANSSTYNTMVRPHWNYAYDVSGNELSQTDPKGDTTTFTYDERGNKLTRTLPGGQSESWTYDQFNRVVTHVDMDHNTTWEVYDNSPQLSQVGYTGRLVAEYRYTGSFTPPDPSTFPVPDTTAWSDKTVYVYDDGSSGPGAAFSPAPEEQTHQGRVVEVEEWTKSGSTLTKTDSTHTTYDQITGQPAYITSEEGTINYVYDPASGRLIETWTGTTHSSATTDTLYGYDVQGRLASVTVSKQDGQTPMETWSGNRFDADGQAVATTLPTTLYLYDTAGNETAVIDPNGTETDYDLSNRFNPAGRTETVTTKHGTNLLESYVYAFDADGRKTSELDTTYNADGTVFAATKIAWGYDALSRLTSEVYDYGNDDTPSTGHTADDYTATYEYDLSNNRVSKTLDITSDGAIDQTIAYTYNSDDQLVMEAATSLNNSLAYSTTNTYDNSGSLKTSTRTGGGAESDTYSYDLRNRLISATVGGVTSSYTYDSEGNRISQTVSGSTTTYLLDPNNPSGYPQVLEEHQGSNLTRDVLGLNGVIAQNVNGTVSYLMADGHGSTRMLTGTTADSSGNIVTAYYNYDAFGNVLTSPTPAISTLGAADTGYQYVDASWDASTQTCRMGTGGRDYDASIGGFLTRDPRIAGVGDMGNANLYGFVGGNPLNLYDPTGHEGIVELGAVNSIQNILSSAYGGAATGAFTAARGVALGLSINQAIGGFLLDSILAPVDQFVQEVAAVATVLDQAYSALEAGWTFAFGSSGQVSVQQPNAAQAGLGIGAAIFGIYGKLRFPNSIYQANHLNQYAAFESDYNAAGYSRDDGLAIMLEGSTQEAGSEHYRFHQYLRDNLWNPARAAGTRVTVEEYNRTVFAALSEIRSPETAAFAVSLMTREQQSLGLGPLNFLKKIPRS